MSDCCRFAGLAALPLLALCFFLYAASYLALSEHRRGSTGAQYPQYRIADEFCRKIFAPLEWADKRLRPLHWGPVGQVDLPTFRFVEATLNVAETMD